MKRLILLLVLSMCISAVYSQWVQLSTDFEPNYSVIAYDSMVIVDVYSFDNYDLAISGDAGVTWNGSNPFEGSSGIIPLFAGKDWVYACTRNGVFRSGKASLSWSSYNEGLPSNIIRLVGKDSTLLAYNSHNLFIRHLADTSWLALPDNIPQDFISGLAYDGSTIALAGSNGVCDSDDLGASWNVWQGLQFTTGIVMIKGDTIIHASPGGVTSKLISSGTIANVSSGLTKLWTPPPGWDYYGTFEAFHPIGDNIFLCGETGVYKLNDQVWHWGQTGLGYASALTDNGTSLFAATGGSGIWGRPLDQLILSATELYHESGSIRVYPNPASGNARIDIVLSEKQAMSLSMLTLNGQLVRIVGAGTLDKGPHSFEVNCAELSAGVYALILRSVSEFTAMKLVVQ